MAWTTPATAVASDVLTAAFWNAQVKGNWDAAFPVGSLHWRMQSETSVETLVDGFGLEANGYQVSRATYAALATKLAGLSYPFGDGNGSTTMHLPDLRGRAAWNCGSHGAADLGDNDGVTESSRQPKHTHTDTLDVSGSPGGTFLTGISFGTINKGSATGNSPVYESNSPSTGGPTAGSLGVTGSVGSGMSGSDAVAHLFVGVMVVKT